MNKYRISSESMWHEINEQHGETGGVYILKCGDDNPIPINRLLGTDSEGILYIGKADSFTNRVAELKKSISPQYKSGSHECGSRYKSHSHIQGAFPYEKLYLSLVSSTDPRSTESDLLQQYEKTFGELPPLNRCS